MNRIIKSMVVWRAYAKSKPLQHITYLLDLRPGVSSNGDCVLFELKLSSLQPTYNVIRHKVHTWFLPSIGTRFLSQPESASTVVYGNEHFRQGRSGSVHNLIESCPLIAALSEDRGRSAIYLEREHSLGILAGMPIFPLSLARSVLRQSVFRFLYFPLFHLSLSELCLFLYSFSVRPHAHVDFQLFSQKSSGIPVLARRTDKGMKDKQNVIVLCSEQNLGLFIFVHGEGQRMGNLPKWW